MFLIRINISEYTIIIFYIDISHSIHKHKKIDKQKNLYNTRSLFPVITRSSQEMLPSGSVVVGS